ncbi:MAG: Rossmann-like and DUF2520 domain-containing protein [Flavobacteriales bacterium]|jgi:predicted short-subunit dehydrogenase-like oxidoreductase (DUF2520 family)|tara:strand:+ start:1168 stop:1932 length:765 start_codon:yes stop_codon:yes gene_type:complete
MIDVIIIGTGNISYHFSQVILNKDNLRLIEICGRKKSIPKYFNKSISYSNDISKIQSADIYLICVSDDAIDSISNQLNINEKSVVVHSSGSTEMNCLSKHKKYGVLYPLQTFSVNSQVNFNNVPIIVEASSNDELIRIKELSSILSKKVIECNSKQRLSIHISAVFANNFSNHMNVIAEEILKANNVDPNILKPLILETSKKIQYLKLKNAQTGPAKRNDQITIGKHLNLLKETKHFDMYKTITEEIIKLNHEL